MRNRFTLNVILLQVVPLLLLIGTLTGYVCIFIPPEKFWPAVILTFGILPMIFLNFIFFIVLLMMKKKIINISIISFNSRCIFYQDQYKFST